MTGALFQQVPREPDIAYGASLVQGGRAFSIFDVQHFNLCRSHANCLVTRIGVSFVELEIPKCNQMQ